MTEYDFDYYEKRTLTSSWGAINEDDKYYSTSDLEDSFACFYVYSFAYLGLPAPTLSQIELAKFMADRKNPHRIVMCMRGLSKSLTSQIYIVWRLLNDPNEKILVMSAGRDRASSYTQFVKKLLFLLPVTKSLHPRHNLERTSSQMFDVAGAGASDSPSVYAVGAGSQVTGMRASLIVYDDVETAQSVESAVKSEANDTFCMEAMNLLMSGKDESITCCTPHSMSSMYVKWIDEKGFKPFVIPALVPENSSAYFGGLADFVQKRIDAGHSGQAVDERLDMDFLMSKKMRIGKSKFKLQYQLDVSDSDDLRYPLKLSDLIVDDVDSEQASLKINYSSMPENILYQKHNGFAKDKIYRPSYRSLEMAGYDYKIMFIDTAGRGADELGIAIVYHLNTRLFVKKLTGIQGGYDDSVMDNIATLASEHDIHTIVVEDNFGDGAFTKMLEPWIRAKSPKTEVEGIKVNGQKEVRIIESLEPIMNQHRLIMDKETMEQDLLADKRDYSWTHQLSHITKERDSLRHDDRLDALSGAVSYMMEWLSDDEERGMEYHVEKEADKTLEFTLQHFGRPRQRGRLNYGNSF